MCVQERKRDRDMKSQFIPQHCYQCLLHSILIRDARPYFLGLMKTKNKIKKRKRISLVEVSECLALIRKTCI